MPVLDLTKMTWRKSSHSAGNGNCVEVAIDATAVIVRDTKNRDAGTLVFTSTAWTIFVEGTKNRAFDLV